MSFLWGNSTQDDGVTYSSDQQSAAERLKARSRRQAWYCLLYLVAAGVGVYAGVWIFNWAS